MTVSTSVPYLLRAARGEVLDRPPVWMMRQAGRYMKEYRDLRDKYPSFRDRSENPELAIEISLQPFRAFGPDGVIMFSDILTPLPGIGIPFDIIEQRGPVIDPPIRSQEQINKLQPLEPESKLPFIREILQTLRREVGDRATVLGFVGAPWTLAAYAIEGKTTRSSKAWLSPNLRCCINSWRNWQTRSLFTSAIKLIVALKSCKCSTPGRDNSVLKISRLLLYLTNNE